MPLREGRHKISLNLMLNMDDNRANVRYNRESGVKIMTNKSINFIKLCLLGLILGVAAQVNATSMSDKDYNDGFLAAESGNYTQAIDKWGPLASSGHAMAQFNIALMYHGGLGVEANEIEAVKWYTLAAQNGYLPAQEFLSAAYQEGWFGLPKDAKKAEYWGQMAELE